jgi:ATPase subunit of ABC transporter with duplicated ATPase domains
MHKPVIFKDISLTFPNKNCFENFSQEIYSGERIAIIGRNGSGKSSLLKILAQKIIPTDGNVIVAKECAMVYVEQIISDCSELSGGQRFNKKLSAALAKKPDVLLLDEPTNHLDQDNRQSLMRMLKDYQGTLIVVTHDTELIRNCADTLWHIDNNSITVFHGEYDSYIAQAKQTRASIEKQLASLKKQKKMSHQHLMQEQQRAKKSKQKGQKSISQKKWPTVVSNAKASRAEQTSGTKLQLIEKYKQNLNARLAELTLSEIIVPSFSLTANNITTSTILTIGNATIGYVAEKPVLHDVNFSLLGNERVALCGKNASGKSTLLTAILNLSSLYKTGNWYFPKQDNIGYLDQHYNNLDFDLTVIEHLRRLQPDWQEPDIRRHLNDFLFRKNEAVNQKVKLLSGGEKVRLSLSLIAAKTPQLLILDEITNNLDLETKEHVIQILQHYPGAMIVVSHEQDFLDAINIDRVYIVKDGTITPCC